jgi:plastocyanin
MRRLTIMVVTALLLSTITAGSVMAVSTTTVRTVGRGQVFKPNQFIAAFFRFTPQATTVTAGQRIRFADDDQDTDEGHTATIVDQGDLPSSFAEGDACFAETGPCGQALAAHDPDGDQQPPFNLVVNKGRPGLDTAGDSLLFGGDPKDNQSISARVTAAPGTTLYYLCALHPWMQGKITVR